MINLALFSCLAFSLCLTPCVALAQNQQEDPELSYYEVIEDRNFFKPKDQTAVAREQKAQKQDISTPEQSIAGIADLMLTGVVKIRDRYKAIIEKKDKSQGYYVRVSDPVEDYIVRDIRKNKVLLEKDEKVFELKFKGLSETEEEKTQSLSENSDQIQPIQEEAVPDEGFEYEENIVQKLRSGKGGLH